MTHPRVKPGDPLTDREIEILQCTALGHGNDGTARTLWLSVDTVKSHLRAVFIKLGVHDRAHLVAAAFQARYLWIGADGRVHAGRAGIPLQLSRAM